MRDQAQRLTLTKSVLVWASPFIVILAFLLVWHLRHRTMHWYHALAHPLGSWLLQFSQTHPFLSRVLHVALNAIPDTTVFLLAIAGLAYLMPSLVSRIDKSIFLRWSVTIFVVSIACLSVLVNAINREDETHTTDQLNGRLATVYSDSETILHAVVSNKTMTEGDRRANIEKILRDQYIATHDAIDPAILAGGLPPSDWMNEKLAALGERWTVAEPKSTPPYFKEGSQPEPAKLVFTLWDDHASLVAPVLSQVVDADADGNYPVSFSFGDKSSTAAENIDAWIEICKACSFVTEPPGFMKTSGSEEQSRHISLPLQNSFVNIGKVSFKVKAPPDGVSFQISFHYACKNCGKVAPNQIATLFKVGGHPMPDRLMRPYRKSNSYTPKPEHQ